MLRAAKAGNGCGNWVCSGFMECARGRPARTGGTVLRPENVEIHAALPCSSSTCTMAKDGPAIRRRLGPGNGGIGEARYRRPERLREVG